MLKPFLTINVFFCPGILQDMEIGILQVRILQWVAISYSRGSF